MPYCLDILIRSLRNVIQKEWGETSSQKTILLSFIIETCTGVGARRIKGCSIDGMQEAKLLLAETESLETLVRIRTGGDAMNGLIIDCFAGGGEV